VAYWLLKTEPEEFSWDDQVKRGPKGEAWTGVRNFTARANLKAMKKGEQAFFYHTGDEKQIVGIIEIIREAYKDPTDEKGVFYCVDTRAVKPFPKPVTLATDVSVEGHYVKALIPDPAPSVFEMVVPAIDYALEASSG